MTRHVDCKDHIRSEGGQGREGGGPGGQGGRKRGANARTKEIFSKVVDQLQKLVFRMLEHPALLSTSCLSYFFMSQAFPFTHPCCVML